MTADTDTSFYDHAGKWQESEDHSQSQFTKNNNFSFVGRGMQTVGSVQTEIIICIQNFFLVCQIMNRIKFLKISTE
jgi:hypothetical protein